MNDHSPARLSRLLPEALLATFLVVVAPVLIVWLLVRSGTVQSIVLGMLAGIALSLAISTLGAVWWERRRAARDVLFGDLMLWGWIRRWRAERTLASALRVLGLAGPRASAELGAKRKAEVLEHLAVALEARDAYTHGHSRRVARHATMIAKRMGLEADEVAKVRTAATLHDVGKINTPTAVLHKPGRLTDEEFAVIRRHPVDGAAMVATLGDEQITAIIRHHHERLDGRGYPDRLSAEQIPLGARIIAVADTFDAITSERPYRAANPHKRAIDILHQEAGAQLDPRAVRAFGSNYFARRPLAVWAAATNVPARLIPGLAASTAQMLAVAASAAALGTAAVIVPTLSTPAAPARTVSGSQLATSAGKPSTRSAPTAVRRQGKAASALASGAPLTVAHTARGGSSQAVGARSGAGGGSPSGQASSRTQPSGSGAAPSVNVSAGVGHAPGAGVNVKVPGGSGTPSVNAGVQVGGSGTPSVSAGASAGGGSGSSSLPAVGAGVSAGGSSPPSVGASVGGSGVPSVAANVGPGHGGLPTGVGVTP
jgi:putative nucleotidyltransferase with HDIG domain